MATGLYARRYLFGSTILSGICLASGQAARRLVAGDDGDRIAVGASGRLLFDLVRLEFRRVLSTRLVFRSQAGAEIRPEPSVI